MSQDYLFLCICLTCCFYFIIQERRKSNDTAPWGVPSEKSSNKSRDVAPWEMEDSRKDVAPWEKNESGDAPWDSDNRARDEAPWGKEENRKEIAPWEAGNDTSWERDDEKPKSVPWDTQKQAMHLGTPTRSGMRRGRVMIKQKIMLRGKLIPMMRLGNRVPRMVTCPW